MCFTKCRAKVVDRLMVFYFFWCRVGLWARGVYLFDLFKNFAYPETLQNPPKLCSCAIDTDTDVFYKLLASFISHLFGE